MPDKSYKLSLNEDIRIVSSEWGNLMNVTENIQKSL